MSIYSGFGTRQQETNYNKAVYNLLYLMQLKISRNNKSCKDIFVTTEILEATRFLPEL